MFGSTKKMQVLVVGAGPVGMMTTLALAKRGIQARAADKEWRTGAHSYALALHPHSLGLLDKLGLAKSIVNDALRVDTLALYDKKERRAEIRLDAVTGDYPFAAVLRQDQFEGFLESALTKLGVQPLWNYKVSRLEPRAEAVAATVDRLEKESVGYPFAHTDWVIGKTEREDVPFVVGADGHLSTVRRTLELDFPEVGESQRFAVFEFTTDAEPVHEMRIVLEEGQTSVCWPMPEGRCRWSFQIPNPSGPEPARHKDRLMVQFGSVGFEPMGEDDLKRLLAERAPWFKGAIGDINWHMVIRFERRLAPSFGKDRLWLAGDAAHLTGPVGIQSMNAGLIEATDLADILADTVRAGGPTTPPRERLEDYNRRSLARWRRLLGLEGKIEVTDKADPWIAERAGLLLPCLPATGNDLEPLLRQVGLRMAE